MRSRTKKLISMLCVAAMLVSALPVAAFAAEEDTADVVVSDSYAIGSDIQIKDIEAIGPQKAPVLKAAAMPEVRATAGINAGGWFETLYAELPSVSKNSVTAVAYSGAMSGSLTGEDFTYLVRASGSGTRIDIPGLKAGTYTLTVTAGGQEYKAEGIKVLAHDRSGFAHYNYTEGVGAYNDDGTLKANAIVVYVTNDNKNTTTLSYKGTTVQGIGNILNSVGQDAHDPAHPGQCKRTSGKSVYWGIANTNENILKKLADDNIPLVVRIIGTVSSKHCDHQGANGVHGLTDYNCWDYGGSAKDNGGMARARDCKNITIEGIGPEATIDGWGIHFMASSSTPTYGKNFEVRNVAFRNVPEDCIGMEGIQDGSTLTAPITHGWVHNCSFYAPKISPAAESDKDGGDGACDFKRGEYFTMDYCYYEGYHKTNLVGSSDTALQYNITWHHNYYKNCESRGPLGRQANMHIYNCWYDGQTSYAMNPRANCYIFSEYNMFTDCKNPVQIKSGAVKSYNDSFGSCTGDNGATVVTDKSQKVSTANKYANFDTDPSSYVAKGAYELDESVVDAKKNIMAYTGTMKAADKVITPDEANTSILKPTRIPAGYVPLSDSAPKYTLDMNKTTVTSRTATVDNISFDLTKDPSATTVILKTGQDIVFKVAYDVYIAITAGNDGKLDPILMNADGEALVTGSGMTDIVPAGTYIIQSSVKDSSGYKEASISKLEIEMAKPGQPPTIVEPTPVDPPAPGPDNPNPGPDDPTPGGTVVSGGKPTASSVIHDFTANGKDSTFYTITGNLATGKGTVNYNNLTLTQCLKMESSTNIKFTAPTDGTLTLVFGGSGGKFRLDGTNKTNEITASPSVTVTVSAGAHTVSKKDSIFLYYMFYTPKSDHTQHTWSDWEIDEPATCFEPGTRTRHCTECNESEFEEIPEIPHSFVSGVCSVCGATEGEEPTTPVAVTAVVLNRSAATLNVNATVTLTATVSPSNAADKTVTWSSSDASVATVQGGVVTAKAVGTATITATAGGKSATCAVTVKSSEPTATTKDYTFAAADQGTQSADNNPVADGTKLGTDNYFTVVGSRAVWRTKNKDKDKATSSLQLAQKTENADTHAVSPADKFQFTVPEGSTAKTVTIGFSSTGSDNHSALALVNAAGERQANSAGKTVTVFKGAGSGTTVTFGPLSAGTYTIMVPENVTEAEAGTTFDSSNTSDPNDPNKRGVRIFNVTVKQETTTGGEVDTTVYVDTVTVTPATATLNVGGTATLTATVTPADATNNTVTWTSSNTAVATVANGVVTAKAAGEAIITATADGVNGLCVVTVNGSGNTPTPPGPSGDGGGSSGGGGGGGGSTTTKKPAVEVTPGDDTFLTIDSATKDNVAVAELTDSQAKALTNNAVKNNSENIVVTVNALNSAGTTRLNVSANALDNMADKTDAALTIQTPTGDVKLPAATVADLGGNSGKTISVLIAKTDDGVKLTVAAGNKILDKVAGGVTAITEADGSGSVAYLVSADGSEKLLKKSYVEAGKLHANLPGSGTIVLKDNAKTFRDTEDSWAKDAIGFAASRELFNGVNELDFAPNQEMTRAMLVTVLYRLEGAVNKAGNSFKDVPADSWYADAVAWANNQGIVSGKMEGYFGPDDNITREQLATILYRYATKLCGMTEVSESSTALEKYPDTAVVSGFAVDGMKWCVREGIIGGRGDGTLAPSGFASRAEVATMLMRFVKAIV